MTKQFYVKLAEALDIQSTAYLSAPSYEFYILAEERLTLEQAKIASNAPVNNAYLPRDWPLE